MEVMPAAGEQTIGRTGADPGQVGQRGVSRMGMVVCMPWIG